MSGYAPLYRLLAGCYLAPPDAELLELAAELPELAAHRAEPELAQRYSWLFDFNVYPYASVFVDPSGMLQAPWSSFVGDVLGALGLGLSSDAGLAAPDHVGALLEAMATLSEREEAATEPLEAARARHGQEVLLNEHLLPWMPVFLGALERVDEGFFSAVAILTQELLLEHGEELLADPLPPFHFPEETDETYQEPRQEARRELQRLLTPARSGLFLSRSDLADLGARLELPVRFAERRYMLENLVAAAAERDDLAALFDALGDGAVEGAALFDPWSERLTVAVGFWNEWRERLTGTSAELVLLRDEHRNT